MTQYQWTRSLPVPPKITETGFILCKVCSILEKKKTSNHEDYNSCLLHARDISHFTILRLLVHISMGDEIVPGLHAALCVLSLLKFRKILNMLFLLNYI